MRITRRTTMKLMGGVAGLALAPGRGSAAAFGYPRLLEGPMLGPAGQESLTVWARASGTFPLILDVATRPDFSDARSSAPVQVGGKRGLSASITVDGLRPDTRYHYRVRTDGEVGRHQPVPFTAHTLPADPPRLRIAFGSCARVQLDWEQRIWNGVQAIEPDLFLWLGDNIYADSDAREAFDDLYARQRTVERSIPLLRSVPQLAIWDDHDSGYNNADGTNPAKGMALDRFKAWWANPAAGLPDVPGVFFRHSIGRLDIFMLDGRYHRTPHGAPDGPAKTMLGAGQKAWLKRELKASRATFKLLVSGTGWSSSKIGGDSWAVYRHERNELLDFIRTEAIGGVIAISGDVHRGEANCVPWSEQGGYDLFELVSSGLAQTISTKFVDEMPEVRLREPYVATANFGLLDFSFGETPKVEMSVRDIEGGAVWPPVTVEAADLVNGRATWRDKIDAGEMKRRERYRQGGSYYGPPR